MNNLSTTPPTPSSPNFCKPLPNFATVTLTSLFFLTLTVSVIILAVVRNAVFFVVFLAVSSIVVAFLVWNFVIWKRNGAVLEYLWTVPDSDLRVAGHGRLVKITGHVSCGSVSLESSYEKVSSCIYTSTMLYEFGNLGLKPSDVSGSCFLWRLAYSERFSTDFNITDIKSGIRALVKAGSGCKVIPLIQESRLVNTSRQRSVLSSDLRKWLKDRNLPTDARLLRLDEGYIKEGSSVSVIGMLQKTDEAIMIVQPPEVLSTGCLWQKLLLPVDFSGLVLGLPRVTDTLTDTNMMQHVELV